LLNEVESVPGSRAFGVTVEVFCNEWIPWERRMDHAYLNRSIWTLKVQVIGGQESENIGIRNLTDDVYDKID